MSQKTVTRMDLSESVVRETGIARVLATKIVERVLQHMSDALVIGEQVKVSSFGTFSSREKPERIGRNPRNGVAAIITPRRVLTFVPSKRVKQRVAAGNLDVGPANIHHSPTPKLK